MTYLYNYRSQSPFRLNPFCPLWDSGCDGCKVASAIPVAFLPALSLRNLLVWALVETSRILAAGRQLCVPISSTTFVRSGRDQRDQCGAFTACSQSAQRLWPVELAECPWTPAFFQSYPDLPGCINNVVGLNVFASATLAISAKSERLTIKLEFAHVLMDPFPVMELMVMKTDRRV
ncbi:hypothetical protein T06_10426 [Trichinella sp. T6]|nr:hypothetical protein T06_10426 [Trichinella sp. T6]